MSSITAKHRYRVLNIINRLRTKEPQKISFKVAPILEEPFELEGEISFLCDNSVTFRLKGRVTKKDTGKVNYKTLYFKLELSNKSIESLISQLEWQECELKTIVFKLSRQELEDLHVISKNSLETNWIITTQRTSYSGDSEIKSDEKKIEGTNIPEMAEAAPLARSHERHLLSTFSTEDEKIYIYRILNINRRFDTKTVQSLRFPINSVKNDWCVLEGCVSFPGDDTVVFSLAGSVTRPDSLECQTSRMCCTLGVSDKVFYVFSSQLEWQGVELKNSAITLSRQELIDLDVVTKDSVETKWIITNQPSTQNEESNGRGVQLDKPFSLKSSLISTLRSSSRIYPLSKKFGAQTLHMYRILHTATRLETTTPQTISFNLKTVWDGHCKFEGGIRFPGNDTIVFSLSGKMPAKTSVEALKDKYFRLQLSEDAVHQFSSPLKWQLSEDGYQITITRITLSKQELLNLNIVKQDSISTSWEIVDKIPDTRQCTKTINWPSQKMQESLKSTRSMSKNFSAQDFIQLSNNLIKTGNLRIKPKTENGKWKHRFVVLLSDSLYIYNSELSKAPNDTILLRGYNRVQREESTVHEWCFSILPASKSLRVITFACVSDQERGEWIRAIQNQIRACNSIVSEENAQCETKLLSPSGNGNECIHTESDVCQTGGLYPGESFLRKTGDAYKPSLTEEYRAKLGAARNTPPLCNMTNFLQTCLKCTENTAKSNNTYFTRSSHRTTY